MLVVRLQGKRYVYFYLQVEPVPRCQITGQVAEEMAIDLYLLFTAAES